MVWEILGSVLGGALQSGSASNASGAQAAAEQAKIDEQRRQFDLSRSDYMPRIRTGNAALEKLAGMLGLGTPSTGGGGDYSAIRQELLPQYTTTTPGTGGEWVLSNSGTGEGDLKEWRAGTPATTTVNEAGLNSAIQSRMPVAGSTGGGELLKPFTGASLTTEPGYQFGLNQGMNALQSSQAAKGGLYSGAALKAANQYAQDYAGTKYNEAFNRDQAQKNQAYNMLTGVSSGGMAANNQVTASGQNAANQIGNALSSQGDARASGYLAQGNIWGNALNQGISAYSRQGYSMPTMPYQNYTGDYNALAYNP